MTSSSLLVRFAVRFLPRCVSPLLGASGECDVSLVAVAPDVVFVPRLVVTILTSLVYWAVGVMAVAEFKPIYALNPARDVTHEVDVGAFDLVNAFYWSVSRPNLNYEKLMIPIPVGRRSI